MAYPQSLIKPGTVMTYLLVTDYKPGTVITYLLVTDVLSVSSAEVKFPDVTLSTSLSIFSFICRTVTIFVILSLTSNAFHSKRVLRGYIYLKPKVTLQFLSLNISIPVSI